jgi:hypothetical protein
VGRRVVFRRCGARKKRLREKEGAMSEVLAEEVKAGQEQGQVVEEWVTIPARILKMRHILAASPEAFVQVWPSKVYVCNGHSFLIGFDWETGAKEKFQFPASALLNVPGVNEKNLNTWREIEIVKRNEPDGSKLWLQWGFGGFRLNGGNPVDCTAVKDLEHLLSAKGRGGLILFYPLLKELVEALDALGAIPSVAEVGVELLEGDIGERVVGIKAWGCAPANVHGLMSVEMPVDQGEEAQGGAK